MSTSETTTTDAIAKDVHPILQSVLQELDGVRERVLRLEPHARVASEAVAALGGRFSKIHAYATQVGGDVWIEAHATDMADVVALRRWLSARGYHLSRHSSYPQEARETHSLEWNHSGFGIVLNVKFPIQADGTSCRYIQVGTKEVPVYELKCG